jgi:L-amino acid N-acyltransferase YncA
VRIRPGTTNDIEEISRVYAQAWKETYQGLAPDAFVNGMTAGAAAQIFRDSLQSNSHSYFFHVAEAPQRRLVGFCDGGKERSHPESGLGELYAIYILKEFQKHGTGRLLFHEAVESLLLAGMKSMIVWVLEPSPYRKFYESLHGTLQPGFKQLQVTGQTLRLVSYLWSDLNSL